MIIPSSWSGLLYVFAATFIFRMIAEYPIRMTGIPGQFRWVVGLVFSLLVCAAFSFAMMVYFPTMASGRQPLVASPLGTALFAIVIGVYFSPIIELIVAFIIWAFKKSIPRQGI